MTELRGQVLMDIEWDGDEATGAWARRMRNHCLALLAELEQSERERDRYQQILSRIDRRIIAQAVAMTKGEA